MQDIAGTPAISLPISVGSNGMPIGVQLAAAYGDERTLIEVAFGLEEQVAWPSLATLVESVSND